MDILLSKTVLWRLRVFTWALGLMLLTSSPLWAWGPGTHFYLANELITMGALTGTLQAIIEGSRKAFQYGSVIADVVVGKDLIDFEEHSHNWNVARNLRNSAETDRERAFAMGFWTHLAADTVAHNIYVPKKILTTSSTWKFGHAYWEMRADEKIPTRNWNALRELMDQDFSRENDLLEDAIPKTVLPFSINHLVQKSIMNLHSLDHWQKLVILLSKFSRYELSDEEIDTYHTMCLQRMEDSLKEGPRQQTIMYMDPTGGDLAQSMKITREELQKMIARGVVDESVYDEALRQLFPEVQEQA